MKSVHDIVTRNSDTIPSKENRQRTPKKCVHDFVARWLEFKVIRTRTRTVALTLLTLLTRSLLTRSLLTRTLLTLAHGTHSEASPLSRFRGVVEDSFPQLKSFTGPPESLDTHNTDRNIEKVRVRVRVRVTVGVRVHDNKNYEVAVPVPKNERS
jgi:hypothetical protein